MKVNSLKISKQLLFIRIRIMSSTSRRRVSYAQLEVLWEFLNRHRDVAMGYNKSVQARENMRRLWTEVAETLNAFGDGAFKDWKGWSAYWVDFKGKLKRKCAALRTSRSRTGGGPSDVPELTEIENKYLIILGEDFGAGLPGVQVDPFPQSDTNASTEDSPSIIVAHSLVDPVQIQQVNIEEAVESERPTEEVPQNARVQANTEHEVDTSARTIRRRRQRHTPLFTQEAARRALVNSNQQRVENETNNSRILEGILQELTRIADTLERMERRLPDVLPTTEQ